MQIARHVVQFGIVTLILGGVFAPSDANAQFIGVSGRKDHVFDPVNRILYITTTSGTVERWHADTSTLLTPWTVGGELGGIDVTPDGATVLVADRTFDTTTDRGLIHRINAASGTVTTLDFALDGGEPSFTETGSWDVVAMNNGKAFFTTDFVGSAWVPFYQLDLATNAITSRSDTLSSGFGGEVRERSWLFRNANHSVMLGLESDISSGPFFSYSALSDTFLGEGGTSDFLSDATGAVSRNGTFLAVETPSGLRIYDFSIGSIVQTLPGIDGGSIFHPSADYLFGLNAATDQVVVYRTGTWNVVTSFPTGPSINATARFDSGVVSFDPATNALFVSVPRGIQRIATNIPEPSTALLLLVGIATLCQLRPICP
jgi:DNA-binding beta-propeller fold protein YncE